MAELAKEIRLTQTGLVIDGQDFPWYITEEGAQPARVNRLAELPSVNISIPCDRIVVEDDLDERVKAMTEDKRALEVGKRHLAKYGLDAEPQEEAA
jgi:hypothetical protein